MGISEMQRHFSAYGSGQLPEFELRSFIRSALTEDPQLSPAFIALTDAYRRANLIDAKLQSTINADIVEITGPSLGLTMVRTPRSGKSNTGWLPENRAANSTDVHVPTGVLTGAPMARNGAPDPARSGAGSTATPPPQGYTASNSGTSSTGTGTGTGATNGSSWDVDDQLSEVASPLYPGSVLRDRFVLVEELGRGGMGVVYKAYDRSRGDVKDRYVAIKVLNEEFKRHPLAVRALQREARKAQKLAHPNVVTVHDFDRDCGNVYMVMEFLSGRSLDQVLRDDGQGGIPLGPAMEIIKCLAAALSYAHEQDIVHCDFKPSNAFLGRDGKVKVLDFGIARAAPSLLEKGGDITLFDAGQLGAISPAYASLEMLQREQPDVRDDVYAFACVVYELLTGCHPYQRIDAVKAYQMELQPRPIRKLSRTQWRALKQGLAFRRVDRCPSIDSLARQLFAPPSRAKLWILAAAVGVVAISLGALFAWKGPDLQRLVARIFPHAHSDSSAPRTEPPAIQNREAPPAASTPTPAPAEPGPVLADETTQPSPREDIRPDDSSRELANVLSKPVPTQQWATKVQDLLRRRAAVAPPNDPQTQNARQVGVKTFVAAATQARSVKQFDAAAGFLSTARSFDEQAPEIVAEAVAIERDKASKTDTRVNEEKRAGIEMLKEQFETQAAAGDVTGATATANTLVRAFPGSAYVARELPRILALGYVHLAKTQFAGGQVNAALQTLEDGRKKFGKSPELKDLEVRYIAAADIYDRLSSAVVLNVTDTKRTLDDLKATEGEEYETAAQMLAQTLADRIADQRAANRESVADKLVESGKQIFPAYTGMLGRGRAGALPSTPIIVNEQ
jgi:serine/threonine protein kinase